MFFRWKAYFGKTFCCHDLKNVDYALYFPFSYLSGAEFPEQVGNRKLMEESGIDIPTEVENFVVELEESAKTGILVAYDDKLTGVLGVADPLKREAAVVIEGLQKMGVRPVMVTGDNSRTAKAVAKEVCIYLFMVGCQKLWLCFIVGILHLCWISA